MKALNEIIATRKTEIKKIEEEMDQLDDKLFEKYLELEYFEEKKKTLIQTRLIK